MSYLILFAGQLVNFLLIVVNIRACAKGFIGVAVVTDFLIGILGFTLIQRVSKADTTGERVAYATGGAVGSAVAIILTKAWDS